MAEMQVLLRVGREMENVAIGDGRRVSNLERERANERSYVVARSQEGWIM